MANTYPNLPGTVLDLKDGSLSIFPEDTTPRVLILGTAEKGSSALQRVTRPQLAEAEFGSNGTLVRGMYEARQGGATNIYLLRIGAKPAKLTGIGDSTGAAGITVQTVERDAQAGEHVKIFWDDSAALLKCWDEHDVLIYDSGSGLNAGKLVVSGTAAGGAGEDIGAADAPVLMKDVAAAGTKYYPGKDGVNPTRMELYEALEEAYESLEAFDADMIVPMDVYLDDPNIADDSGVVGSVTNEAVGTGNGTTKVFDLDHAKVVPTTLVVKVGGTVTPATLKPGTGTNGVDQIEFAAAPEAAAAITADYSYMVKDALLYFRKYTDGYETKYEWHTAKTRTAGDESYAYHEVNFAHQLAMFCHNLSVNDNMALGAIGVRPPQSGLYGDLNAWVGRLPEKDLNGSILANGEGLLGNKFISGRTNHPNPGFWYSDTGYLDDVSSYDVATTPDIGRYLSIVATPCIFYTPVDTTGFGYVANGAALYGGFAINLPSNQAPTNKVLSGVRLPYPISKTKCDLLVGAGYVVFGDRDRGVTVLDGPTAATKGSDYTRLSTLKIVMEYVERARRILNPYLGQGATGITRAAMQTAIDELGAKMIEEGKIQRFSALVSATAQQQVLGEATLEVVLVPAFELRRIHLVIALSAA